MENRDFRRIKMIHGSSFSVRRTCKVVNLEGRDERREQQVWICYASGSLGGRCRDPAGSATCAAGAASLCRGRGATLQHL